MQQSDVAASHQLKALPVHRSVRRVSLWLHVGSSSNTYSSSGSFSDQMVLTLFNELMASLRHEIDIQVLGKHSQSADPIDCKQVM